MKKFFLLLLLLCAGHQLALATDVTISASAIPNANFGTLGGDLSGTCSVTSGGRTVAATGGFRSTMVGLGGFQITINGTRYTVESVQSQNQLTLTTAYAGATSGSASFTLHKYVLLRIYSLRYFTPNGEGYVIPAGDPDSGDFFKQVACSVVNNGSTNTLYIPALTLPATTDAVNPEERDAKYFAAFYTSTGAQIRPYDCFSSFRLPFSPTVTTWPALCTVQSPGGSPPAEYSGYVKSQVYNKGEIETMLPECAAGQLEYFDVTGRQRKCLSLGANLGITNGVLDASGSGGSGGGGYAQIQNNGSNLPQRSILNLSDNILASDDLINLKTRLRLARVPTGVYNLVTDYNASGVPDETTGSIIASSTQIALPAFPSYQWKAGFGILIVGAGPGGADLLTTVSDVNGSTLTLATPASVSVSNAIVRHDDTAAIQAAVNAKGHILGPQGHYIVSQPIVLPATTEGGSITFEGAGPNGETTIHYQGLGSLFIGADGTNDGLVFKEIALATSTPGAYSVVRPTINRGSAFDFSKSGNVNYPRFEGLRVIGWGRWGLVCGNCQGAWFSRNVWRSNASGHIALISPETVNAAASEPNVASIRDSQFDLSPYVADSDVAFAAAAMVNGSYVMTTTTSVFTSSHEGRLIRVIGAGLSGGDLLAVIKSVDSGTQVTLSARNQTGSSLTGLSGTVLKTNIASIYLHRSNFTSLAGNIIQGNYSGSPANVNSLKIANSKGNRVAGLWVESTGGSGGYDIELSNTQATTITNYHSNADPVTASENAGGNIKMLGASNVFISGMDNPNPTVHFNLDANTRGVVVEASYLSAPENTFNGFDASPDRLILGEGVTFSNDAGSGAGRRGTSTLYDETRSNLLANARFEDGTGGLGSWTNSQPTYTSVTNAGTNRYQRYLTVNTQGISDGASTTVFEQVVAIPDSLPAGPMVLGYDWFVENFGASPTVNRDVQVEVQVSSGTGYNAFKFMSQNSSSLSLSKWERAQYLFFLGAGSSRTVTVRIKAATGPNVPRVRLANFKLQPGRHSTFSREEPITDLAGGRIRAAGGLVLDNALTIRGSSGYALSASGEGKVVLDSSTGKFRCSENGGAYVDCVGAGGGGTGTGTQVTVSQTAHGLANLTPVFNDNAGAWKGARDDTAAKKATGLVVAVPTINSITVALASGFYTINSHGLSTTAVYYLSDTGGLCLIGSGGCAASGSRQPILEAIDANTIHYFGLLQNPGGGGGSAGTLTAFSSGNLSPLFTTSVSNPTTTPGLSFTLNSQTANTLFSAPDVSGGTPVWRKLVIADINSSSLTATGVRLVVASGIPADGCASFTSGVLGSTGLACGSGGGGGGLSVPGGNGIVAHLGTGSTAARTITGTASQISVVNGDGVSGAPTLSLPNTVRLGLPSSAGGALAFANASNANLVTVQVSGTPSTNVTIGIPSATPADGCATWTSGVIGSTGAICGSGGAGSALWNSIGTATGNAVISTVTYSTTFTNSNTLINSPSNFFRFEQQSNQSIGAGFGTALQFALRSSTGAMQDSGRIISSWQNHVNSVRAGQFEFAVTYSGSGGVLEVKPMTVRGDRTEFRPFDTTAGSTHSICLFELAANGTDTACMKAPDTLATSYTLVAPSSVPSSGSNYFWHWNSGNLTDFAQVQLPITAVSPLSLDGSNNLSCATCVVAPSNNIIQPGSVTFTNLGTPTTGIAVCSDCGKDGSNNCTSGGTGALAVRIGSAWKCFQ